MKRAVGDVVIPLLSFIVGMGLMLGGAALAIMMLSNHAEPSRAPERTDRLPPTCDTEVEEAATLPLEAEPVAMLVCADQSNNALWTAPAELVEGDLSRLVAVLSDLEPAPLDDYACNMVGGPAYDLVLRFPDGQYAKVHGDNGGCGVVTVASGEWFGAPRLFDTALALVEERRERRAPPEDVEPVDLSCDANFTEMGTPTSYTGEVGDLVRLVSCWEPNAPELGNLSETVLRESDVRIIVRDLDRRARPSEDVHGLRCPGGLDHHYFQHLIGQTSWGDVVLIVGECRRFIVVDDRANGDQLLWRPSPQAQALLDQLRR